MKTTIATGIGVVLMLIGTSAHAGPELYTPPLRTTAHEALCSVVNLHPTKTIGLDVELISTSIIGSSVLSSTSCAAVAPGVSCAVSVNIGLDTVYCKFTVNGTGKRRVRGGITFRDLTTLQIVAGAAAD